MGERQYTLLPPEFKKAVRMEPSESALSGDAGAILLRELGERSGLWRLLARELDDPRCGALITHPFEELLATAVLLAAQGWSTQRDVDLLRHDPVLRLAVWRRKGDGALRPKRRALEPEGLASQPTLSRLARSLSITSATRRMTCGRENCGTPSTWVA